MPASDQLTKPAETAQRERAVEEWKILEGLNYRQKRLARLLARGMKLIDAARSVGYNYSHAKELNRDPEFRAAVEDLQELEFSPLSSNTDYLATLERLRNEFGAAVLERLLRSADTPAVVLAQLLRDLHAQTGIVPGLRVEKHTVSELRLLVESVQRVEQQVAEGKVALVYDDDAVTDAEIISEERGK